MRSRRGPVRVPLVAGRMLVMGGAPTDSLPTIDEVARPHMVSTHFATSLYIGAPWKDASSGVDSYLPKRKFAEGG